MTTLLPEAAKRIQIVQQILRLRDVKLGQKPQQVGEGMRFDELVTAQALTARIAANTHK
jgi:hypothetical protein